jgi:quinone-modifying oxidoreductase subunit QmoC
MIWASWGLKDKLYGNPDVWLCHQCGECTSHCPRGVKPGDVLSSLRNMSYAYYAKPKFLGKLLSKPALLPIVLLIPFLAITAIIWFFGNFNSSTDLINYSEFFPHAWLNGSFGILALLVMIGIIFSIRSFWRDLSLQHPIGDKKTTLLKSLLSTIIDIIGHKNFTKCKENKTKYLAHLFVFWGFIALLVVTLLAIVSIIFDVYPLDLWNPIKILGNLATVSLFAGLFIMMAKRLFGKEHKDHSNYYDTILLVFLFLLTLSGVGLEASRFLNWSFAYYLYVFHLCCVWMIVLYAPFTKFAHVIYRTTAMVYAKYTGRS